ncbi:MAG: hypothetical protein LBE18_09560, partial [Planctomycetaceae bacterium]|nr:hypothetical protein [Planctomycetaceae bacterium]
GNAGVPPASFLYKKHLKMRSRRPRSRKKINYSTDILHSFFILLLKSFMVINSFTNLRLVETCLFLFG